MYNYRLATVDDLEDILRMGELFHASQMEPLMGIPFDPDTVTMLALGLIDEGLLVVATEDPDGTDKDSHEFGKGPVVAMVGITYSQYRFNIHHKVAEEIMLWIEPEHRGNRLSAELLAVAGIGAGADDCSVSVLALLPTSPESAASLYRSMGYTKAQEAWVRSVKLED
jgi:hypothetical protein